MAKTKTYSRADIEKLEMQKKELAKKIAAVKRQVARKENEEQRKARTHRLLVVGALVEKYAGEISSIEMFEEYLKKYGGYIRKNQANQAAE